MKKRKKENKKENKQEKEKNKKENKKEKNKKVSAFVKKRKVESALMAKEQLLVLCTSMFILLTILILIFLVRLFP